MYRVVSQDFSKILVVLGLQIQGKGGGEGEVGTPIRLMTKLIGLK